jgi:hypothetical protein
MHDMQSDLQRIDREWLVTRIVLVAGFVIAIVGAAYVGFAWRAQVVEGRTKAAQAIAENQALQNAIQAFCPTVLSGAKSMGLVPPYTELSDPAPHSTQVTGRYLCAANTDSSRFLLAADLICRNVKDAHCLSLYAVTQNGTAVIYQRKK